MKNYFFKWVLGFFALLSLDLFMEGLVFEWLGWNSTTKNDWFDVLSIACIISNERIKINLRLICSY